MWPHFTNLLARSWDAMVSATGTTTLGFIVWTLVIAAVSWAATVAEQWFQLRRKKADLSLRIALRGSFNHGAFMAAGIGTVVLTMFTIFLVLTTYKIHQVLVAENAALVGRNADLNAELNARKHSISTTDPIFPNIIYLLQAFSIYRHALNGTACQIKITAPPESQPLASVVAQFSNSVSSCTTFGPLETRTNPDAKHETMDGMIPDLIVFHAAKDDRAADQLFNNLGNQIQLQRSYEIPVSSPEHFVWLQFGSRTKWNSELR